MSDDLLHSDGMRAGGRTAGVTRRRGLELTGAAAAAGLIARPAVAQTPARIALAAETDVLIVVDVQNDFLPGGALAVPKGDEVIPVINDLAEKFRHVVLTQDWHPAGHISFATSHPGKKAFEIIDLPYGKQVLWPDHCIWDTKGAEFSDELDIPHGQMIVARAMTRRSTAIRASLRRTAGRARGCPAV
jgi:nicotinamidase/pyrazinamidase